VGGNFPYQVVLPCNRIRYVAYNLVDNFGIKELVL
jgi:hypothetical protein